MTANLRQALISSVHHGTLHQSIHVPTPLNNTLSLLKFHIYPLLLCLENFHKLCNHINPVLVFKMHLALCEQKQNPFQTIRRWLLYAFIYVKIIIGQLFRSTAILLPTSLHPQTPRITLSHPGDRFQSNIWNIEWWYYTF